MIIPTKTLKMINKAILIGYVGGEIKMQNLPGGAKVATFRIGTTEKEYTSKNGTKIPERTDWHNIRLWGGNADVAEKLLTKGSLIYIEGKIRTSKYQGKDGKDTYFTEIVGDVFKLLSKKQELNQKPIQAAPANQRQSPCENNFPYGDDLPF